ncbi:MAG: CPBP family intramembrane metalloprotease [Lachnospiraceae bacterium]|nr:CPBP family intramembrane metalloprotease [Lachnospiraceae bacterium]
MNNKEKKEIILHLIVFCLLAYLPIYVITPILNVMCGELIFSENISDKTTVVAYGLGALGMFAPSIAHLITRLLTKEGFKDTYLGLNMNGNVRYYVASIVIKLIEVVVLMFLIWGIFMKGLSLSETFPMEDMQLKIGTFLLQLAFSIILFFPAFGEEWGWRGYMMPKLMEVVNKPVAIVVGGIIWGLWHAPLTVSGHNFGTDYKFYPWLGILFMCIYCILMNALLTLLTERTKSIYPASFCHMINNNLSFAVMLSIFGSQAALDKLENVSNITAFWVMLPVCAVTGIVSFVLFMKTHKQI